MSAHISMLDLLFSSDLHRDALLGVLTKAQIPKDISVNNFSHIVGNVLTVKQITFSDEKLPAEGTGHNKALYIAVRCNGKLLAKVLIDNGSALNICPWSTLMKLGLQDVKLRPSTTIVREFDGARRESIGEIDLVVEIGPVQFQIACQVMHFPSIYNVLLGRPWIHTSSAVPSSLHQMLKFIVNEQLITIFAEEDCILITDSESEQEGNKSASVSSHRVANEARTKMTLPIASIMMAKEMIRGGYEFDKGLGRNLQDITVLESDDGNLDITHDFEIMEFEIQNESDSKEVSDSFSKGLEQYEEKSKPNLEETEIVNIGIETEVKEINISIHLNEKKKKEMIEFLFMFQDVFAWSYSDMTNISTDIVVHRLSTDPSFPPILMAEEDREKTAFITPWGTFCYIVMPFGLKNAGATYQRTMIALFHDMIHKEMEVCVDDIIIKSKKVEDHLIDLRKLFERLRKYNLKLNPAKCAFGAPAGKLLGFIVSKKGIEIDPAKIKAI
ncbi:uncharacterized protein [Coffea arabica]|uniref:Reverse transcriptase domain-containing protein n=1 Tax=Coffea arabica TaxID=13443 RepID=A0ABM4VUF1_COFAR